MANILTIDRDYVTRALLQLQYFPNVRGAGLELPSLFSTEAFSLPIAEELAAWQQKRPKETWKKWVTLRTRRFDGLIRRLGIPHPSAYSDLVIHVRAHWKEMAPLLCGEHSQIKPELHVDGRLVIMDYSDKLFELSQQTRMAHGKSYMVKADISNCFPSIYSHAVDWAVRGKSNAKKDLQSLHWAATLDKKIQCCSNGETKGLVIGPAISNVLAELVLQRVDGQLVAEFTRYIDDYKAYFEKREDAENFLVDLQIQLAEFKLDLNTRKTRVISLHNGTGDAWISDVTAQLPARSDVLSTCRFLQFSERLAKQMPDKSALRFAVKTHLGDTDRASKGEVAVVDELVRITQFHPHILPHLSQEIGWCVGPRSSGGLDWLPTVQVEQLFPRLPQFSVDRSHLQHLLKPLAKQLKDAARRRETDTVLWLLYIMGSQLGAEASDLPLKDAIVMDDDLVWIGLASMFPSLLEQIADRVKELNDLDSGDREEHWLARYELFRVGALQEDDLEDAEKEWMEILVRHSVRFSNL